MVPAVWRVPDNNFRSKNYHLLLLLPFDAKAFKTCKNTIKLCPIHQSSYLVSLRLGKGWKEVKVSLSNLINYFAVSGDSNKKKKCPQKIVCFSTTGVGGRVVLWWATPKTTNFFDVTPYCLVINHQNLGCMSRINYTLNLNSVNFCPNKNI